MQSQRLDTVAPALVMDHLIRRECARADRSGHVFSLVLFRVGGSSRRRRSVAAHRLARVMLKRGRLTDEVGWVGEEHLAALLPDTPPHGARAFADGVTEIMGRRGLRPLAVIHTYPQDRTIELLAWPSGRTSTGGKISLPNFDIARPANGHSKPYANAHGHSSANGNGKFHANGNSHAGLNGHSNGHRRTNGHAHAEIEVEASYGSVATALLAPDHEELIAPRPSQPQAAPHHRNSPVVAVEELLAIPMPFWKRTIDIVSALLMLVLFSPVIALAALAIKFTSPGPVVYTQRRSGLGGKPFLIYKLRTMIVGAEKQQQELRKLNEQDGPAFKLTRDPRVTRVGSFLRKTSIDELPQLWNILKGEMSLVGPRPLPIDEQEGCEQWQRHRLNVTPGITCIWQVKGRSQVSFADWVRMDVEYIRRRTIFHDLSILFSTIPAVLLRKGAR